VIPSGNLGNASALFAGFEMMRELGDNQRMPRLVVAQAANANPMYRAFVDGKSEVEAIAAQKSHASAIQIGNPVSAPRAMRALRGMNGVVEQATEQELADACARADRTGLYTCPHTGVALACVFKLREKDVIKSNERVIVVSTANGLKFTEFKLGYHEKSFPELDSRLRNEPIVLPAELEAVKAAL
jgi:threonine synthase